MSGRGAQLRGWAAANLLGLLVSGCATATLDQASSLRSYDNMVQSDGMLTRSQLRVSKEEVLAAKTIRIIPTVFSEKTPAPFTPAQRRLVTNAADRALCAGLSERFYVVASEPADLTVQAVITHVVPTDPTAVGVSKGVSVAKTILLPGVPVPVPRIPVGLGSLSLEAEARDSAGQQKAAMVWGRAANAFDTGRMSEEGDAYGLAASFGGDFSQMLVTGVTPFGGVPSMPSMQRLGFLLGGAPKYPACEAFGRAPGLIGMVGDSAGVPPDWTDKGPVAARTE